MAEHDLHDEFLTAQRRISLGDRALVAIAAHLEVRYVLRADTELQRHGLDDVLIGSYARRVSIWPGKDVDVFGRLKNENVESITAESAYGMFGKALVRFADEGRLRPQPRSFKIDYSPTSRPDERYIRTAAVDYGWSADRVSRVIRELGHVAFEFSVDVVPAVIWGDHYGIPEIGRVAETDVRYRTGGWRLTDPVELTRRTQVRNRSPQVAGAGAYVRSVKAARQVKAHHLPDIKPSSLFYEFVLYEGFQVGAITGSSWADITASSLAYIANRLRTADVEPVCDPVLGEAYGPAPSAGDLAHARSVFDDVAHAADRAVRASSRCQAAIDWRHVFGGNQRHDKVFPLPVGCRGTGSAMGAAAANVALGGTTERSFG